MVRNAWPDFFQDLRTIPPNEYWLLTRSTLTSMLGQPGVTQPTRLQKTLIAVGLPRLASGHEQICAIDTAAIPLLSANPKAALNTLCRD